MWGKLSGFLTGLFSFAGSQILTGLGKLANGVASAGNDVWNAIQTLINNAIQGLSSLLDVLHSAVSSAWAILTGAFSALERGFNELLSAIWQALTWVYKVGIPDLYRQLSNLFTAIGNLGLYIVDLHNQIIAFVVGKIADAIGSVITFVIQNVYNPLKDAVDFGSRQLSDLWTFVHGLLDDPMKFGRWLIFPLIDVLIEGWETIAKYAGKAIVGLFIRSFMQFPDVLEEILSQLL